MNRSSLLARCLAGAVLGAAASAYAQEPRDASRAREVANTLSELLQLQDVRVPGDAFDLKKEEIAPGQDSASRFFHATYRSARNTLMRAAPGPANWTPRERALLADCMSAQAAAVAATRKVVRRASTSAPPWTEEVRRFDVFLSGFLSEAKSNEVEAMTTPTEGSPTHGMFMTEKEFEAERDMDLWPWFERDIAFLALNSASAYAADAMGRLGANEGLLDKRRRDEPFREWSQRQCSRLMFLRSAQVDYLDVDVQGVKDTESPAGQESVGDLVVRNIGARRLVGSTQVILLSDLPAPDAYDPIVLQVQPIDFDLAPLASSTVHVSFSFRKQGQRIPRYMAGPASAPTAVEPMGEPVSIGTCVERAMADGNAGPLVMALAKYGADSPAGFANSMAGPLDPIARRAKGMIPVPGANETVVQDYVKWMKVEATLYAGTSEADARAAFKSSLDALRGFCGESAGSLDDTVGIGGQIGGYSIKMFSPSSELLLRLHKKTKDTAAIRPSPFTVSIELTQHGRLFP